MKLKRLFSVLVLAASTLSMVLAQPVTYSTDTVAIRAGVVLLRDSGGLIIPSGAPHIWGILDGDKAIKPADWRFQSGSGNGVLTTNASARFGGVAGTPINKTYAPYWELDLRTATTADVLKYDVLQISLVGNAVLSTADRELLREFVDKGGLLWVDFADAGAGVDGLNNFPSPVTVRNAPAGPGSFIQVNPFHPLILGPNQLSLAEVYSMTEAGTTRVLDPFNLGVSPVTALLSGVERDSLRLEPVATSDSSAVIAVTQVGDGFIMMTSRSISRVINRDSSGGLNNGLIVAGARRDAAYTAATKLVMNALSLRSRYSSAASGSRNSSSNGVTIGVPAIKQFGAPAFAGQKGRPVLANGRLVVASGGTLYVYDAEPRSDVDRDGGTDDGIADPVGSSYDRVWSSANLGVISEPTYVEVPNSPIAEQVWVQSADGRVHGFNLNQAGTFTNVAPFATIDPPVAGPATQARVFAPTAHEGILYIADDGTNAGQPQGRLWMVNLRMAADIANLGGNVNEARNIDDDGILVGNYAWGASGAPGRYRPSAGSPSLAYVPIRDSSGGMDLIAYVGTQRQSAPSVTAAGLTSFYLGSRGEIPTDVDLVGTGVNLTTRAAGNGLRINTTTGTRSPKGLTVRVYFNNQILSAADMATYFTGAILQPSNGTIQLQIQPAQLGARDWDSSDPTTTADDVQYRVDYMVDWTNGTNSMDASIRGNVFFQDQTTPQLDMVTAPAVAPSGNVGVILSGPAGGSYYNLLEDGQGVFLVRGRFEFHSAIQNLGALGLTVGYPPSLVDEDDLVRLVPIINAPLSNIRPTGIAVSGNSFIVTANANKNLGGFGVPTASILSFESEPGDSELTIELGSGQNATGIVLKQPDMARSGYAANPVIFSAIPSSVFSIEPIENTTRARVRMRSLASSTRGALNSCMANNLPVIVSRNAQTDTIYEPESPANNGSFFRGFASGRWNQLNWYTVMNGYNAQVGPVIAGERIIVGGASFFPSLILNGFSGPPTGLDGLLYGMDRSVSPDDTHLVSTSARPWISQLYSLKSNGPITPFVFNNLSASKAIRWPQLNGITDLDDFRVRVLQASILGESQFFGLAAGEGSIAITSDVNTTLFKRSDFVLADAGRLSRFDPSGNPLWSIESTGEIGTNQPNIAERPRLLSSPNRIYPDGSNGYVFVDPGNNLVARMDAAGREVRSISKLRFHEDVYATTDPSRQEQSPRGQSANEAKLLRNPQDVAFWTTFVTAADVQRLFPSEGAYRTYTNERWDNWLIADAGNNRVVQLIDRYMLDANGRVTGVVRYVDRTDNEAVDDSAPALGILWWHSPEEFTGKRYAYNSIGRTTVDVGGTPRTAYALGFNNIQPSQRTFGLDTTPNPTGDNPSGYGGAIIYDGPQTKVINEFVVPANPSNVLMGTAGPNFAFNLPARTAQTYKVSGLTSVTVRYNDFGGGPVLTVMLSTDRGVFELVENTTGPTSYWEVVWMLPVEVYEFMRRPVGVFASYTLGQLGENPQGFRPMHARRLDSGDVLVVNGYFGTKKDTSNFSGEVLILDGSIGNVADARIPSFSVNRENFGFNALSVKFELPPVQGIRGIFRPVFAERQ